MTLVEMIRKREIRGVATATVATTATPTTEARTPPSSIAKGAPPKASTMDAWETKAPATQPTDPTITAGGSVSSITAPVAQNCEIQPATPIAKAIYWETGAGQILGPAIPEFLMRDGETFWIVTTFRGQFLWINADRLRSKKAFNAQSLFRGRAQLGLGINDMKGSNRTK